MEQQQGKRGKEPKGFRCTGEEDAPVAVSAEEAKKKKRGGKAERDAARTLPANEEQEAGCQQRVENIRRAEQSEGPVIPPVRGEDSLPE